MVATFGALVRHPAVVPTLEDGRLVAVTAQSVHHDMAAALTVVRVGDRSNRKLGRVSHTST